MPYKLTLMVRSLPPMFLQLTMMVLKTSSDGPTTFYTGSSTSYDGSTTSYYYF